MPAFFPFTPGTESGGQPAGPDTSPLLGRFRAVPRRGPGQASWGGGSLHVGYGAIIAAELEDAAADADSMTDTDDEGDQFQDGRGQRRPHQSGPDRGQGAAVWKRLRRLWRRWVVYLWLEPKQGAVKKVLDSFWSRYVVLIGIPSLLAVGWCGLPFPKYYSLDRDGFARDDGAASPGDKVPGHGAARVQLNFWFFLLVYYGLYNLTALVWITKMFNLYSLNWWPQSLGFPTTFSLILLISLAATIPVHLSPSLHFLTAHNTVWIAWTFVIMALPMAVSFLVLTANERHLGPRTSLSEIQRIFTTSWWTGEPGSASVPRRDPTNTRTRRRVGLGFGLAGRGRLSTGSDLLSDDEAASSIFRVTGGTPGRDDQPRGSILTVGGYEATTGQAWFPASFVRFVWFCIALFVGLMAYVIGEAYAEIYLRTLPHDSLETIVYVYSWVATVHLLDGLTGWILGSRDGERVGSYPLSWVFKLYFMLTYQTYVRALYARLRSPQQFILLQALSSSSVMILTPLTMSPLFHRLLTALGLSGQSYGAYQKVCLRNVFIRTLAENASMAAFLGSVLVLHFGPNQDVYPYFAFDDPAEPYDFALTFYASSVTWACELAAGLGVRGILYQLFTVDAGLEGRLDLAVWPELLPTSAAVMLHVLQNMLFSIIRLQFPS